MNATPETTDPPDPPDAVRTSLVGYRLALRLARREVLRRPGRTLLVALLVAIPVAGMAIAAVTVRTGEVTALQNWHQQWGNADAAVGAAGLRALPPNRHIPWHTPVESRLLRTTDARRSYLTISTLDMADPLSRGIYDITSGRAPAKSNEVFLTRAAARQLGVRAGDTLRLVRPADRTFTVTGVGEDASSWGTEQLVLPSGAPYPWKALDYGGLDRGYLVAFTGHPSPAVLHRLEFTPARNGASTQVSPALVTPLYPAGGSDADKKIAWSWAIGALALTVVGIVIAAAFAIGARRQLVTLGQLAGNGAPPKVLRRVLFLQGTLTGIVGAIGGIGLAAVALALLAPHADRIFRRDVHPYVVRPADIVPIFLLGVLAETIAAFVPARAGGRIPVLAALAGRRPLGRVPRWLPVAGVVAAAGGLALLALAVIGARGNAYHQTVWNLTASVGGVAVLLGACAFAPFYVSVLEPAAARARGSWRVATRSLARQRTRTSAVVSAIAATCALVIAGSALFASARANDQSAHHLRADEVMLSGTGVGLGSAAPQPAFVADVKKIVPHSRSFQLQIPAAANTRWTFAGVRLDDPPRTDAQDLTMGDTLATGNAISSVGVADRALIQHYGLNDAEQQLLTRAGALVLAHHTGTATIAVATLHTAHGTVPPKVRRIAVPVVNGGAHHIESLPSVLITPTKAAALGLRVRPSIIVLRSPHNLTTAQRNEIANDAIDANDALGVDPGATNSYNYFSPPGGPDPLLLESLLVALALVLTLFVVAVNLALSATETRDERDVLTVVGAAPGTMSRTNGYKAAVLTVMGAVLAVPVGLLPVAVFLHASAGPNHLVLPIGLLALLLLAVPVAAGVVTTVASAVALRVRPVRISTMAFD